MKAKTSVFPFKSQYKPLFAGAAVLTLLFMADYVQSENKSVKKNAPTIADLKYGPDKRQAVDIWLAKPKIPGKATPLCIYIHGGGFRGGDKSRIGYGTVKKFLNNGISFASMNYRLIKNGKNAYPTPMYDCARGIQVIRSKAAELNIDPNKIACYGGSAGAGISLWLAFHDDLAKPQSNDPVEKQSTRITAAGSMSGQSSYDMHTLNKWFGVKTLATHISLGGFYAMKPDESIDSPRIKELAKDASPINHLSKDDPPVYLVYKRKNLKVTSKTSPGVWVHHPVMGIKLQEAMRKAGVECSLSYPGKKDPKYKDITDFLIKKLSQ